MVITAYLEWHNCNNEWKAGGMPVLPVLATSHSVSSSVSVKIPLKGLSSVAAQPKQMSIHPLEHSTLIHDIHISVETKTTGALILNLLYTYDDGFFMQLCTSDCLIKYYVQNKL